MSTTHTAQRPPQRRHDPDLRASPCFAVLSVEDGGDLPAGIDCGWLHQPDCGSAALVLATLFSTRPRQSMHA